MQVFDVVISSAAGDFKLDVEITRPDAVKEIFKCLYVDDLLSGGPTIEKAKKLKLEATEIFSDAKFELHKWHSNRKELETACEDYELSFAKERLEDTPAKGECKLLDVGWDKVEDTLYMCVFLQHQPSKGSMVS